MIETQREKFFSNLKINLHLKLDLFFEKVQKQISEKNIVYHIYSNLENPVLTDNFSRGFMLGFLSSYLRELADGFLEEQIGDKIKNNFEKSHRTFMKILLKTFIKHADKLY